MIACEQLIFGFRLDGAPGRDVLACSPGLEPDCAREVVGLCEGWGRVPPEGLRRAALVSCPLEARLGALPGRLHAVIRIGTGLKPLYHALVLGADDFAVCNHDPFTLTRAVEVVEFVLPGQVLGREIPMPPPPPPVPEPRDQGFVDEALRQLLANRHLDLPLEAASEESDRFFTLLIRCLPDPLRRGLHFASWTPGGRNVPTLAAVHRDAAFFRAWRPYLMSLPLGQLTTSAEEYVTQVRDRLASADLTGLADLSKDALVELGVRRTRPSTIIATVPPADERPRPAAASSRQRAADRHTPPQPAAARPSRTVVPTKRPAEVRASWDPPTRAAATRRRARTGWRQRLVVLGTVGLLAFGVYRVWQGAGWQGLGAISAAGGVDLHANPNYGILDVGRMHDDALRADTPERVQEALHQAAQLLDTQALAYVDQVSATLASGGRGDIHAAAEALPAARLVEKGERMADELCRLALADVSLLENTRWRDLAKLDGHQVAARHDSVLTARGAPPSSVVWTLADRRLGEVRAARSRVITLGRVQDLLGQSAWRPGWERELADAGRKLQPARAIGAARWSAAARSLARLKEAEREVDFGAAALTLDDPTAAWRTGPVATALPEVRRALAAFGDQPPPPLLAATVRFYNDLASGWDQAADLPPDRLAALLRGLEQNGAVAFDRAAYGDHIARLGVALVQGLRARGVAVEALPESIFPGGRRDETLSFLAAAGQGRDGAGWQREAASFREPFFSRWATRLARQADATRVARTVAFTAGYDNLAAQSRALAAAAARHEDPVGAYRDLCVATSALLRDHPDGFTGDGELNRRWRRANALREALTTPWSLSLADVTVRLDQAVTDGSPVLVELSAGGRTLTTSAFPLSPAAPAGSGWVGTTAARWKLAPAAGERLAIRVLAADDRRTILTLDYDPWLAASGPETLKRFQPAQGSRVCWRLAEDYWSALRLPELD